jgi:hypothetical protein
VTTLLSVEKMAAYSPVMATSVCDFNIIDALGGELEVMLVHAVNGGYLKPDSLDANNHAGEARSNKDLDADTIDKKGHLWYLTPAIFADWLRKKTYFIESAAGPDPATGERRRITHHVKNPTGNGVHVGRPGKGNLPDDYQYEVGKANGIAYSLSQCWIPTLTCCGGLIFTPALDPNLIWGTLDNSPDIRVCPRPIDNWGGGLQGPNILNGIWYPRRHQDRTIPA